MYNQSYTTSRVSERLQLHERKKRRTEDNSGCLSGLYLKIQSLFLSCPQDADGPSQLLFGNRLHSEAWTDFRTMSR